MTQEVIEARATMEAQSQQAGAVVGAGASLQAASLIHVIAEAARDPSVDIEKMERLWAMHESLKKRADEEAFNAAMNKAQSEMGRVAADAANPQTRSVYATYGRLDKAVRPIYTRHGFSISFNEGDGAPDGFARILAYVSHSAGHTRTYKLDMPADGKGAKGGDVMTKTHATGAAHSYGRRYLLKDIFNIAIGEEDTDGNGEGADTGESGAARDTNTPGPASEYERLLDAGRAESMKGMKPLTVWWGALTAKQRTAMNSEFGALRKCASQADRDGAR